MFDESAEPRTIAGRWVGQNGRRHVICNDYIEWGGGGVSRLRGDQGGCFQTTLQGQQLSFQVKEAESQFDDRSRTQVSLHWNNGDVWLRDQPNMLRLGVQAVSAKLTQTLDTRNCGGGLHVPPSLEDRSSSRGSGSPSPRGPSGGARVVNLRANRRSQRGGARTAPEDSDRRSAESGGLLRLLGLAGCCCDSEARRSP